MLWSDHLNFFSLFIDELLCTEACRSNRKAKYKSNETILAVFKMYIRVRSLIKDMFPSIRGTSSIEFS